MKYKFSHIILFVVILLTNAVLSLAQSTIDFNKSDELLDISGKLLILEDKNNEFDVNTLSNKNFQVLGTDVPNLGFSKSTFWVKTSIINNSNKEKLLLELSLPIMDYIEFYHPSRGNSYHVTKAGELFPFYYRKYKDPNYFFDLDIPKGETKTFYIKVKSSEAIQLPIKIGSPHVFNDQVKSRDILSGIYFGIMLVMILYNLFIYFTVKDKSYISYVVYIILILLTQTTLQGYPFQYLWPDYPVIAKYSLFIFPSLVGIASMVFMNIFLNVKLFSKGLYKLSYIFSLIYLISIVASAFKSYELSQLIMQTNAMLVSFYMLATAIYIVKKGFLPAKYFLIAWSIFLLGVIAFIMKDLGVLPYNNFTRYTMQIGSAIETVLLSFALAARINIYKRERLDALEEKEKLVREQNIVLEQTVVERTSELNKTLSDLKEAQSQLVDSEKMSSLGQLTAGIAHEINNPINFVSSNITPLRRDLEDIYLLIKKYEELSTTDDVKGKLEEIDALKKELDFEYLKTEIPEIINGIEDGATRTKEIVRGLRNFSHLDEAEQQKVDINEGVESTLILIKTKFNNISLKTELGSLPIIECYPSKLNQVFMNLIDNAIGAIESKNFVDEEAEILIKTYTESNSIIFSVEDNGVGMTDSTREKMIEPFFTTKDVGKGTGLGLSIAYGIVEKHSGKIEVESMLNIGTVVKVKIPF